MSNTREGKTVHQRLREAVLNDQGVQLSADEALILYAEVPEISRLAFLADEQKLGRTEPDTKHFLADHQAATEGGENEDG